MSGRGARRTVRTPIRAIDRCLPDMIRLFLPAVFLVAAAVSSVAADLYFTDFDEFTAGPDRWAGTNGWVGTSAGLGVHGIDDGIVPALDKTAYIGGSQPASRLVTVYRSVGMDPVTNGMPIIEFEVLMGIADSNNGRRDSFFFTFYNQGGGFLASIRFSNEPDTFGLWRLDGAAQHDTGVNFYPDVLHLLYACIDFGRNRWSADLDGIPLFTDVTFNATGETLSLGFTAAEWQIAAAAVSGYGDNWMLVGDWSLRGIPYGEVPFRITSVAHDAISNRFSLSWTGEPGFTYEVHRTGDLATWQTGLPGGSLTNAVGTNTLTYSDTLTAGEARHVYRVKRLATP